MIDAKDPTAVDPRVVDIFHIHWPEQLFWAGGTRLDVLRRLCAYLAAMRRLRRAGVKLVWMVHNAEPHDRAGLAWTIYRLALIRLIDGVMTLSPATVDTVKSKLPGLRHKPFAAVWHPAYPKTTDAAARARAHAALSE